MKATREEILALWEESGDNWQGIGVADIIDFAALVEQRLIEKIKEQCVGDFVFNSFGGWQQMAENWRESPYCNPEEIASDVVSLYRLPEDV